LHAPRRDSANILHGKPYFLKPSSLFLKPRGGIQEWVFYDAGFILGGQNGAVRNYTDIQSVDASPWSFSRPDKLGLRVDWEDSASCGGVNDYTQYANATATITADRDLVMQIAWSGIGEYEASGFERMDLSLNGEVISSAISPGGRPNGLYGCEAGYGPVISTPPSPVIVNLTAGDHLLHIEATTGDGLYHMGCYYQFDLSFSTPP
jgi:hypothetical protein